MILLTMIRPVKIGVQVVEALLHRILVAVDPHGFHRILDPVGEQRLETSVAADVLAHRLRVERNLQSTLGGCLLDEKVVIGLLVVGHRLARLELALVLK